MTTLIQRQRKPKPTGKDYMTGAQRVVNSAVQQHDELVVALRGYMDEHSAIEMATHEEEHGHDDEGNPLQCYCGRCIIARAALAKAEVE